ncbi:hypothetical protein [Treponema sp.]|uniref:hypothetical protein n=1 Tax=Treponema sp. TaxID=166 RepID=UPI003FD790A2
MRHSSRFEGGEDLTTMGASWFVSYCYYEFIDPAHNNWLKVKTWRNRVSVYESTKVCKTNSGEPLHKFYLKQIVYMDDNNLNKNSLDLSAKEIKAMVQKLLEKDLNRQSSNF